MHGQGEEGCTAETDNPPSYAYDGMVIVNSFSAADIAIV